MSEMLKYYTCEKCGGELNKIEDGHFCCKYCKVDYYKEVSLPEGLVIDLHNAELDRRIQKFEDALNKYDEIIKQYPDSFDAYWGATLSDYGIQYEKDYDGRIIPTVHRFSETPVTENSYYVNALKFCGIEKERVRIEESAAELERIRAEIKKTVGVQEPYDIFLCYKETPVGDGNGYTSEYHWAAELYGKLRGEGYKVFFAKESLPVSKGSYEAHIFPALRSAKLMLILTTSVENVESVWVKNEWSRFIRFSKDNPAAGKRFKVIMSGFKPEKLPRELRNEQVLNHDSMGWVDQLYGVIADTFCDEKKEEEERKRREAEALDARIAERLEEERKRWATEELKKREEEERRKREEEERRKREDEERRRREEEESGAKVGESIKFGSYPQDRSGNAAEIKWLVLDVKDGKALVVSQKALECKKYNEDNTEVTWETCALRKWLNNEFLNTAFSEEERAAVSTVTLPDISFDGDDTQDRLFLLSASEVKKYFSSENDKMCKSTGYAASKGIYVDKNSGNCEWWLRTPGAELNNAVSVSYSGVINHYGSRVDNGYTAVRPAMWLTLKENKEEAVYIEQQLDDGFFQGYVQDGVLLKGTIKYKSGAVFEGIFENGNPRNGRMVYAHGDVYEGDFNEYGANHGRGKMTYEDGDVYEGDFKEGRMHGKGKMLFASGNIYEGDFVKDKFHGKGKMFYNNPEVYSSDEEEFFAGNVYEGYFFEGFMQGSGKMTYANGNVYDGEWLRDQKFGYGKMTYKSGMIYEGDWVYNYRHGNAKLMFINGDVFQTKYDHDEPKGRGVMTFANGKTAKGRIKDGVFKKTLF